MFYKYNLQKLLPLFLLKLNIQYLYSYRCFYIFYLQKYLFCQITHKLLMKLLITLLAILTLTNAYSPQPVPSCSTPQITLKDLPISLNQIQTFNANNLFKGYNLSYSVVNAPEFLNMREKIKLYKRQNITQSGLKNFHMDHQNNHWGQKLVTVSENGNSTIVRWGRSDSLDMVPTLDDRSIVENDPKIFCLDAIWLRPRGLIMVDCIKQIQFGIQNIFFYVNSSTQEVLTKKVPNDMWISYSRMQRRKIFHYVEDGQQYLIRAYFADAVDPMHAHNTYVQILLINDPFRPWTIKVMDRSYLGQDKLSITDFKIYLGDIYILDYHSGVISFDITPSQNIVIKGRYRTQSGYHKMGVYSNNMANEVLLALANEHGIYEVDWTNQIRPVLIAKYSLFEASRVTSLWVNQQYIAAQIVANVTIKNTNTTQQYHSTYIFDRGTRTYTNAYGAIKHPSYLTGIDLNLQHNLLLTIDQQTIDVYTIDQPLIFLYPTNPNDIGRQFKFTIRALSSNQYSDDRIMCVFDMRFVVVDMNSKVLWPTGLEIPEAYYANFPGQFWIHLDRYINGPNVTWGVVHGKQNQTLPPHWILQQNDTLIHWDKEPSMFKYTFLRKQQFQFMEDQFFFLYTQDSTNVTHIAQCRSQMMSKDIYCKQDSYQPHINKKIQNLTATAFQPRYGQWLHLVAVLFDYFPNQVFVYNVRTHQMFSKPIILGKDWQGKIQSIEFIGRFLVVVLRHVKTIVFYDMYTCNDHQDRVCEEIYRVDSITMDKLGISFFSPVNVYSSDFHPSVLFIQNVDSVIILDITKNGVLLLDQIYSPASKQAGFWKWQMAITKGHLILINPPNTIEQYSLLQLYTRKSTHMTKAYPIYNYTIPDKFDCDFSDKDDLLYITAIDKDLPQGQNSVILVYKSAVPAVSTFYDVFHINGKYQDMLIDVTGVFCDYVSVTMGSILMMFRQFQNPILIWQNPWADIEFNITFTNDKQHSYYFQHSSKIYVINNPTGIIINNSQLNQSDFLTNQIKYDSKKYQQFIINDDGWFNGSVLNYTIQDCAECGGRLKVVNHLEDKRDFYAQTDMEDYVYTHNGGVIQQFQSLIEMKHNGSIDQVSTFPSVLDGQRCQYITYSWMYDMTVSACQHLGQIYLYTTTYTSFKPFVNGPFYTGAKFIENLFIQQDLLFIVDVYENPWQVNKQGGIIIMAMNHNPSDPEMFDQIEIIETDDLQHAVNWPGGPVFIGNADIVFTNDTQIYRLAITEIRNGMFFVDFKWTKGRKSIQILKVQFIDLNALMIKQNLHMPNNAFFQSITVVVQFYDKAFNFWQLQLVITTRNFHTLKFDFRLDRTGVILESKLSKVFYRYSYYQVANYIKSFDGYFAVIHNLPAEYEMFEELSKKILTVYDTRERWVFDNQEKVWKEEGQQSLKYMAGTNLPAQYMLGGMRFRKGRLAFDFNFTFTRNRTDPFRNIGLLAVHDRDALIRQIAIHDHIKIITQQGISSDQQAKFKANSDFASVSIPLKIVVSSSVVGGLIIGIVIGCLFIAVGCGYVVYRWNMKRKKHIQSDILKQSLLDRDTINVPYNDQNGNTNQENRIKKDEDNGDQEVAEIVQQNVQQNQQKVQSLSKPIANQEKPEEGKFIQAPLQVEPVPVVQATTEQQIANQ